MTSKSITRTNYFKIKSDKVSEFIALCEDRLESGSEGSPYSVAGLDGSFRCFIGGYGLAFKESGVDGCDDRDDDEEGFFAELQKMIAEDDAAIITTITWEGLRYAIGHCTIVTAKEIKYFDTNTHAIKTASEMLGNPDWDTRNEY